MTSISANAALSSQIPVTPAPSMARHAGTAPNGELREAFTQFVGEAFFGQMFKAMRATVGKPAYFHGGRAEEVFQGQLDQKLAEHLTEASAARFADPMFERQFPNVGVKETHSSELDALTGLRRI